MKKNPIIYLEHILDCINKIESYAGNLSEDDFLKNTLVQDAVIRNLEIIGEATKKLDESIRLKYPEIEWKKIAGMRDKLIHDYIGVDLWAVWGVVENILPSFALQLQAIITELRNNPNDNLK
jgi:uncharacterized protein with HEPN domain